METTKPKLKINWVQLIGAAGVIAFALASGGADIYNNCVFGSQKSAPIAAIFVLAGVGLMLFPAMAEGWRDAQVWVLVAACAGLSVFAGYQNHMTAQRNFALAEKAVTERYEEAHRAIQAAETAYNEAKAEAASISETMGSKELAQLVSDKRDTIKSECVVRGNRCRKAEDAMEAYGARLADAKAREEAQERATKALERMEAEKARAPVQAKAASVTETEELIMAFGLLALTVIGATFTHRAHKLFRGAISLEQPKTVRAKKVGEAKPVEVVPVAKKRSNMDEFLDAWTDKSDGPPLQAGEFKKCLAAHWAQQHPGKTVPSDTALGRALGSRYAKTKTGGKQCYYARLKRPEAVRSA